MSTNIITIGRIGVFSEEQEKALKDEACAGALAFTKDGSYHSCHTLGAVLASDLKGGGVVIHYIDRLHRRLNSVVTTGEISFISSNEY